MTTFSIVTVVLDDALGLQRTADSLRRQTFTDFEWIVIDGASRLEDLVDPSNLRPEPHVFVSEKDEGIYDAMNKGWRRATGDWVLFLNAGDCLCQDRTLSDVAEQLVNSDADWAFGLVRNVDASGKVMGIQNASPFNRMGHALGNTTVPHQATFMRRQLLKRLGGFGLDYGLAADQELIRRAAIEGPPLQLVWPIADFMLHGAGMQVRPSTAVMILKKSRAKNSQYVGGSKLADATLSALVVARRYGHDLISRLIVRAH